MKTSLSGAISSDHIFKKKNKKQSALLYAWDFKLFLEKIWKMFKMSFANIPFYKGNATGWKFSIKIILRLLSTWVIFLFLLNFDQIKIWVFQRLYYHRTIPTLYRTWPWWVSRTSLCTCYSWCVSTYKFVRVIFLWLIIPSGTGLW